MFGNLPGMPPTGMPQGMSHPAVQNAYQQAMARMLQQQPQQQGFGVSPPWLPQVTQVGQGQTSNMPFGMPYGMNFR